MPLNNINVPLDDIIYSGTRRRKCDFKIFEYLFGLKSYITFPYYFTRGIDRVLTTNVDNV